MLELRVVLLAELWGLVRSMEGPSWSHLHQSWSYRRPWFARLDACRQWTLTGGFIDVATEEIHVATGPIDLRPALASQMGGP
jgi:hypothetical protein